MVTLPIRSSLPFSSASKTSKTMRPLPATSAKKNRSFHVGFRFIRFCVVVFLRLRVGSMHVMRTYGSELPFESFAARLLALITTTSTSPRCWSAFTSSCGADGLPRRRPSAGIVSEVNGRPSTDEK